MDKKSKIRLVKDVFNKSNTNQFLTELDLVLKTISYYQIEKLLVRYNIHKDPECVTFLETMKELFQDWKIINGESVLVDNVETRVTKCFTCFLGKKVIAYEFYFQHKGLAGFESRIIYAIEFAVFTDIKNDCLVDFGVCNAFLSKKEVNLLNRL